MFKILAILLIIINLTDASDIFRDHFVRLGFSKCRNCSLDIDRSGACPKLLYSVNRVAQNCSSLNLAYEYATNWTTLYVNPIFVTELLLQNNNFKLNLPYNAINKVYLDLKFIDLSHNYINEYTTDLQLIDCSANYLHDFDLSFNSFTKIPLFSATCMSLIQRLRLSSNYLLFNFDDPTVFNYPIDPNNINKFMPLLQILDVSFCNIQYINQFGFTVLTYFPNLKYLNLLGNKIKIIYENPFVKTPILRYLNFELNLIQCKLEIRWLKYYLQTHNILGIDYNGTQLTTSYFPTCFDALSLSNQSILYLDADSFYTDIYLSTTLSNQPAVIPIQLKVKAGNTIDLDCSVYSIPQSNLWWTFNERVLSKTVANSPYEFLEDFNESCSSGCRNSFNRTSVLRIKNIYEQLGGIYSCKAFYQNLDINQCINVSSISFNVSVYANPNEQPGAMLSAGAIAAIVIGSVLAFILLCLLLLCCIYCCCYKRGLCCFKSSNSSTTSSSSSSSSLYNKRYGTQSMNSSVHIGKSLTDMEESASGFRDIHRTKPNYVINTISKGSLINNQIQDLKNESTYSNKANNQMYQDSAIDSWRIIPVSNVRNCDDDNDNYISQQNHEIMLNVSPKRQIIGQQNQHVEQFCQYDETLVYNVNNPSNTSANKSQAQIYSIRQPIDFVSTNEAFLNDNCTTEIVNNEMETINDNNNDSNIYFSRLTTTRYSNNSLQQKYPYATGANDDQVQLNDIYIPIDRKKQYQQNHYHQNKHNNNYNKYDSDV